MNAYARKPSMSEVQPRKHAVKNTVLAIVTLAVFVLAVIVLQRSLAKLSLAEVLDSLRAEPASKVLACGLLTCCSYFMLTLYDLLAVHGARHPLPWRKVAPVSFIAFGIAHSAGLSWISGGSVRYRAYSKAGLSTLEIAAVIGLVSGTFMLGVGTLLSLSMLMESHQAARIMHLEHGWQASAIGTGVLSLIMLYLLIDVLIKHPVKLLGRVIHLPPLHITLSQIVVASVDLCFCAGTLYVLLPETEHLHYFSFVGLYVLALQAGVLSNVPGGVGVFETVLIQLLPGGPTAGVVGAVLIYRVIYYVIPLVLGTGLFAWREAVR
jgi:uncharacterized membrane protein YbhN (UPF0104 family)